MKAKKLCAFLSALVLVQTMSGCKANEVQPEDTSKEDTQEETAEETSEETDDIYAMDYLVLVNKLNPLPADWEEKLQTEHFTNSIGEDVEVEVNAYHAYLDLKKELEAEGIYVDLDSARRSVEAQQKIMDDFTAEYGADYAAKIVAKPGYSEHHTGLALDLYLIVDGKDIIYNEDLVTYPEIWEKIHEKLTKYGFILRYLPEKEHLTGYAYEPWHIRYVADPAVAAEITEKGITLEGYLGAAKETEPQINLGTSSLYTEEELSEMAILIKCRFAAWAGCELQSLTYAGDEKADQAALDKANELSEGTEYVKAAQFLMNFHTPKENSGDLNPDQDYTDYQWLLGCDEEGSWEIVSWGD
jgi:D-alanyl-D-alanine carboxypeptidase